MKSNKVVLLQVLSPFGNWQHQRGMQVVNKQSAKAMRQSFGALKRLFGAKLPIFEGHPDDTPRKKLPKPLGYIRDIHETIDGIAITAEYDENTYRERIENKYSALSPRWEMKALGREQYTPIRLISVGLTNNPNIPQSGKVLLVDSVENTEQMNSHLKQVKSYASRCGRITEKAKVCLNSAEETLKQLKSDCVGARILKIRKDSTERIAPTTKGLSDLARERSERLGEPYSLSFAKLRQR